MDENEFVKLIKACYHNFRLQFELEALNKAYDQMDDGDWMDWTAKYGRKPEHNPLYKYDMNASLVSWDEPFP
jgi:hypothetical protein